MPGSETIRLEISKLRRELANRQEDTGVHRINTEVLSQHVDAAVAHARRVILGWVGSLLTVAGVGGGGAILYVQRSQPAPSLVQPEHVQQSVEQGTSTLKKAVDKNASDVEEANRKIQALRLDIVRIGDEQAESVDYLGRKLDAISPRARRVDDIPESVKRHRELRSILFDD